MTEAEYQTIKAYLDDLLNSFGGPIPTIRPDVLQKLYTQKNYPAMLGWIKNSMRLELRVGLRIVEEENKNPMWIEISKPIPVIGTREFKNTRVTVNVTRETINTKPFDWIVAGFAHELSHVVLFSLGHKLQEDEKAVDLTSMILGFENFDVTAEHTSRDRIWVGGYLTLPEREFAANYLRQVRRTRDAGRSDTDRTPPQSEKPLRRGNYVARHWRGELSLPVSYWVNGLLGTVVATITIIGISRSFDFKDGFDPRVALLTVGLSWAVIFNIALWQLVGNWRSATNYQQTKKFWGGVTKFVVIIGAARLVAAFWSNGFPQLQELVQIYQGDARVGTHAFEIIREGKGLRFTGGITFGAAKEFEGFLKAMPNVKMIVLDSIGGRVYEAERMGVLIKGRGLDTRVTRRCMSACTTIFLSGRERTVSTKAQLGFHQPDFPGLTNDDKAVLILAEKKRLQLQGVTQEFAQKAVSAAPASMWFPTILELLGGRVVTNVSDRSPLAQLAADDSAPPNRPGNAASSQMALDLSQFGTRVDRQANVSTGPSSLVARTNEQPSFDCRKARQPIEQIICSDADLALWDGRLGTSFRKRAAQLDATARGALLKSQQDWLKLRDYKCDIPAAWTANDVASVKPCLILTTTARIEAIDAGVVP